MLKKIICNKSLHKQVIFLSMPMVLSNLTVPLLGLVDTMVIGHLEHSYYLGGVALGNTAITVVFFLLGFLRMATTGLNAQAYGKNNKLEQANILLQGLAISIFLSFFLLGINFFIAKPILNYSDASILVKNYALQYINIRIFASPAVLVNMVVLGWLLGKQNAVKPMILLVFTNVVNIILDIYLVWGQDMKVIGVALASNIADYSALLLGAIFVIKEWKKLALPNITSMLPSINKNISRFINLNRDIFLRSLCLQMVFAYMIFHGASLGDDVAAANAVLISFLMLISYLMDGFAYSTEALVGKSIGSKDLNSLKDILIVTVFWALVVSLILTFIFAVCGSNIIGLITSINSVQHKAMQYLPWLIAFPLVSMWCFLLDGFFVGATRAKEMRNSMFISCLCFFIIVIMFNQIGNHILWAGMLCFMIMRTLTLGSKFLHLWRFNII